MFGKSKNKYKESHSVTLQGEKLSEVGETIDTGNNSKNQSRLQTKTTEARRLWNDMQRETQKKKSTQISISSECRITSKMNIK